MTRYSNILCATDFTPDSDRAIVRAMALARENGAKLTLLHVVDHFPVDCSNQWIAPENVDPKAFRLRKASEALASQVERVHGDDAEPEVVFTCADAGHEIIHYADEHHCDLIVIGSRVHEGAKEPFGSVAGNVLRHAHGPLEVVHVA
ncbi:universal stress protein [Endothiovibrio diazotrophicus]